MDLSQDIQRMAAIKAVKLEHKSASAKRAVSTKFHSRLIYIGSLYLYLQIGYLMQSANLVEDLVATWDKITKAALAGGLMLSPTTTSARSMLPSSSRPSRFSTDLQQNLAFISKV